MELSSSQVRRSSEIHMPSHGSGRSSPDQAVDHVSRQVIDPSVVRTDPVPDLRSRIAISDNPKNNIEQERVDAVGRYALGMSREEAEQEVDRLEEKGGYILIPADREFRKEDCLAGEKAPLWFSSQIGGGIGRSVQMTKDVEDKDKEKKPEEDVERQSKFDETFARFKFELGLGKDDVVNYSISDHSIEIYDREGTLKGKYDLLDNGLDENPQNPIKGGGGLKQLLRDRGYLYSDTQINDLAQKLSNLNQKMRTIIEPETGGRISFVFEAGNKGNVKGLVPFLPRFGEGQKVFNPEEREKFLIRNLERLNFIKTDHQVVGGPHGSVVIHKHTLKPRGAAAFTDIKRAKHLQSIVIANFEKRINTLQKTLSGQAKLFVPHTALIPNTLEKERMEALKKEIRALNQVKDEISGKNPEISERLRNLQSNLIRLESKPSKELTPEEKQQLKDIKSEIAKLTAKNQAFHEGNSSALQLMLLQLNRGIKIHHEQIRPEDERLVAHETTATAKQFLGVMQPQQRTYYGVGLTDAHGADIARNNMVDHVAQMVASGFEDLAQTENASKSFFGFSSPKKLEIDPSKPSHQEIQQLGTNMGALVYDISTIPSSDPTRLRKRSFVENRPQSQFSQESRALEFLIAGVLHNGEAGLRGFSREEESIQKIMQKSLVEFRAVPIQDVSTGCDAERAVKSL